MTEDEMVGWHNLLNGHEFEQTLAGSEGQRGLVCCSLWVCKESDATERLNNHHHQRPAFVVLLNYTELRGWLGKA